MSTHQSTNERINALQLEMQAAVEGLIIVKEANDKLLTILERQQVSIQAKEQRIKDISKQYALKENEWRQNQNELDKRDNDFKIKEQLYKEEIAELKAKLSRALEQIEVAENEKNIYLSKYEDVKNQNTFLQSKIQDLETQITKLNSEFKTVLDGMDNLQIQRRAEIVSIINTKVRHNCINYINSSLNTENDLKTFLGEISKKTIPVAEAAGEFCKHYNHFLLFTNKELGIISEIRSWAANLSDYKKIHTKLTSVGKKSNVEFQKEFRVLSKSSDGRREIAKQLLIDGGYALESSCTIM